MGRLIEFCYQILELDVDRCCQTNENSHVLSAVSDGTLTPIEGTRVMGLIDSYRRTLELTDIEHRLKALESDHADH